MITDQLTSLVERGQQQLKVARFVGKFAVDRAVRDLRRRLAPATRGAVPVIETIAMSTADDGPEAITDDATGAAPADGAPISGPTVGDLVLPDYDHLPAAHVVSKLASLTARERAVIEEYERAHRHRRTILGKIEQLRA